MTLKAIVVTSNSLDKIVEVNGGARPEVEEPYAIFIHNDDPDGHNDIVSVDEFFANYWHKRKIMDTVWTEVKKF